MKGTTGRLLQKRICYSNQQALSSISRQIRSNRELERLFHATWRQPVIFGKNKAFNVRLYGGQNYAQQFDLNGDMRAPKHVDNVNSETDDSAPEFGYGSTAALTDNDAYKNTSSTDENSLSGVSTAFEADKLQRMALINFLLFQIFFRFGPPFVKPTGYRVWRI